MEAKRVLIIGAAALGPKVACRLKRLRPDFHVTMLYQGEYISFGGVTAAVSPISGKTKAKIKGSPDLFNSHLS